MNEIIRPLQYVRYDVWLKEGELVCSIPNVMFGYYDTWFNEKGELIIEIDYGTN